MIGMYKGEFETNGICYNLQHTASTKASRTDFTWLDLSGFDGFSTFGADNLKVVASVYIKGEDTHCHGDYNLYTTYNNLMNTVRYYYFRDGEIIKNNETQFTEQGITQVTHHLSKDNNLEFYQVIRNGNVEEVVYRCGIQRISLELVKTGATVKMLTKLDYSKITYEEEGDYNVKCTSTYRSLNEIATFKNLDWLEDKHNKYFVVETREEFDTLMVELNQAWKDGYAIAFDTETSGLVFNRFGIGHEGNDELVGICITHKVGYGWYIPVNHVSIPNIDLEYVLQEMKPLLEQAPLVTHYGKFDWMVMYSYGIDINIVDDTFIMLYILSNIDSQQNLKLKNATEHYLGFDQIELSDIFPGGEAGQVQFQVLPKELVWAYAPTDADTTLSLYKLLKDRIPKLSTSLYKHEVHFMKVLGDMEFHGNKVDMESMKIEAQKCLQDIEVLKQAIYSMVGYTFNLNSPPAMSKLLYDDLKCEVLTKTNQGTPSTGATALKNLSNKTLDTPTNRYQAIVSDYKNSAGEPNELVGAKKLNASKYPVLHVILKYKKLIKLHSTFFAGLERDSRGGWIFSSYNQTRAATGRTISNFQQIPGSLKHLIVPWSDDYYMMNLDYKSIELFVMVGIAGQTEVIKQFSDPEADAHRIIGSQLLKKPPQEISGPERKDMKVANFGVPFDMGPHSLAQFLRGFPVTRENVEYASQLKADYLNSMPLVKRMFTDVRDKAQTKGTVTTKFGRMGVFRNLPKETDPGLIARGRRQAGNLIIQGTAADILKIATNRLYADIKKGKKDIHITGTIHDELILIVNKKHHPYEVIRMVKDNMELKIKGFPTIFTGIAVSHNWGEGHGMEILEIPQYLAMDIVERERAGNLPVIEGDYRDYILDEVREYLLGRFKQYFVDLGLNLSEPEKSNFYEVTTGFKHMYLGPRCVAYYTDFGGNEGEPKLDKAIKLALKDVLGWDLAKVESYVQRDTPVDGVETFEDVTFDFDLDEFSEAYYDFEEGIDEYEVEDIEEVEALLPEKQKEDVTRIICTYDSVLITADGLTHDTLRQLNTYFIGNHSDTGLFAVNYYLHGKLVATKMRVDSIDRDYVMSIIQSQFVAEV